MHANSFYISKLKLGIEILVEGPAIFSEVKFTCSMPLFVVAETKIKHISGFKAQELQ